jgi:hypothetical protein
LKSAGHHLFFLEDKLRFRHYAHHGTLDPFVSIPKIKWNSLIESHDAHASTLALQGLLPESHRLNPDVSKHIAPWRQVVDAIDQGLSPGDYELRRAAYLIVSHGAGPTVRFAQSHFQTFEPMFSPQYRVLVPQVKTLPVPQYELMFHGCRPDLYLWMPSIDELPRKLLICFCTKSNTLNAPMPLAHTVLARLGVAVLYVYNRRGIDSSRGLAGYDFQQTVDTLRFLIRKFAFQKVYGMGTSLGGYAVCAYAAALGMRRVINFSGSRTHELLGKEVPLIERLNGYPLGKIMTVASQVDKTDIEILEGYDRRGFLTPRTLLNTPTHGSFTGAWLEGKLPALFTWLLGSPSLTSQKAP